MFFRSRLCDICRKSLELAFESIKDRSSDLVPHHLTKESLVDSILHRSCHLCRLIIYHLKLNWALAEQHWVNSDTIEDKPTSLTEEDFADSDFDFATFHEHRRGVLSYIHDLPEELNFRTKVSKYLGSNGVDGVFGLVEFDCDAFNHDGLRAAVPRFWIFDERAFGAPPITNRLNNSTDSESCQDAVASWLAQNPINTFPSTTSPVLPTRLLDLSDVETLCKIKLVDSKDIDPTSRYVTLSHCWGALSIFRYTKDTEEELRAGKVFGTMPKTFQDAITVARWANVRYIWIDSCCIKQDSTEDWAREAKMMQKVYQNTHFNISADHSENSEGGLFQDRLAYKYTPCPFVAPKVGQVYILPQFGLTNPLTQSAISTRAWVTQERFLSPRILHFTSDQLFWESEELYACETFPKGLPDVYDKSSSWYYRTRAGPDETLHQNKPGNYEIWGRICQDYTRSKLTYTSDKLIAFAGIVGEFQTRLPHDTYVAGLWKNDIINGLLWKAAAFNGRPFTPNGSKVEFADPYITATMPDHYRAPSWSWLAKDCGIAWQVLQRHSAQQMVDIIDTHVDLVNDHDCAGAIRCGYIKLEGHLRAAQWTKKEHIESIVIDGKSGEQLLVSPEDPTAPPVVDSFRIQRDTGDELPIKDIICLPVRFSQSQISSLRSSPLIEGLILGPTKETDTYERLGHFEAKGEGYCQALLWELRDPAPDRARPWDTLDLKPRTDGGTTFDLASYTYNEEDFKAVDKRVITIV